SRPDASGIWCGKAVRMLGWRPSRSWRDYLDEDGRARKAAAPGEGGGLELAAHLVSGPNSARVSITSPNTSHRSPFNSMSCIDSMGKASSAEVCMVTPGSSMSTWTLSRLRTDSIRPSRVLQVAASIALWKLLATAQPKVRYGMLGSAPGAYCAIFSL